MKNLVILIGHLGDEVKMHHFENGGCIGRFPLATNSSYTNKQTGEVVESTEWHNIVVRNKGAEVCEKYLKKGSKVYVEGMIKTRKWQAENGEDRYSTEIHANQFKFLDSKADAGQNTQTSTTNQSSPEQKEEDNNDLPF